MNIAIDIDDTLTESFSYFIPFVAEYFHISKEELQKDNISYNTFPDEWKKEELQFCKKYYDKVVPDTPFKKDARYYVNKLHEEGHKIVIITARTKDMYTDPYKTTKEELDKNHLLYDEIVCVMDKAQACQERKIDLFIDDSIHNLEAVFKSGIRVMLFTSRGNRDAVTPFERVSSWSSIYERIQGLVKGYPNKSEALKLLDEAEQSNSGAWYRHSKTVAFCAEKIAAACGMNTEKAYVFGLLHDIGRKFGIKHLGHIYDGYAYMNRLGYTKVAQICLTHSFPTKNMKIYLGKFDIEEKEQKELQVALSACKYDDYDRLIQLCDALGGSERVLELIRRNSGIKIYG